MPNNQVSFFVKLLGDSKGAVSAIGQANNALLKQQGILGGVTAGATKLSNQLKKGTDRIQGNAAVIAGGLYAAKKAFDGTIGVAENFESAILKVSAVSGGAVDQLEKLSRKAGKDTVFSATESASALLLLAQAGLDAAESQDTLIPTLNLAAAAQIELATATDFVVSNLTVFQQSTDKAEKFADIMAKTTSIANTNMEQLGAALEYAGPVAQSVGISFEGLNAMIAAMATQGIKGEKAGTQLRAALTNIIKPTGEARAAIEAAGVSLDDIKKSLNDPIKLFKVLKPIAQDAEKAVTVFGKRNLAVASAIANASDRLVEFTDEISEAGGTAQSMADTQISGLQGQMKLLKSAFEEVILQGSKDQGLLSIFTQMTKLAIDAMRGFQGLPSSLKAAAIAIGILTPAVLALNAALGPAGLALAAIGAVAFVAAAGLGAQNDEVERAAINYTNLNAALDNQLAKSGDQEAAYRLEIKQLKELVQLKKDQSSAFERAAEAHEKGTQIATADAKILEGLTIKSKDLKGARQELADSLKKSQDELNAKLKEQAQFLKDGGNKGAELQAKLKEQADAAAEAFEGAMDRAANAAENGAKKTLTPWQKTINKLTAGAEKFQSVFGAVMGGVSNVFGATQDYMSQKFANEQQRMSDEFESQQRAQDAALTAKFEQGLITEAQYNEQKEALDNALNAKKEAAEKALQIKQAKAARKAAGFQKGINIANALAGGALAVINTLALPIPRSVAIPLSAVIGAMAAAQVAIIAATPLPEVPAFREGGIKTKEGMALLAEGGKPEAILPANLTSLLLEAAKLRGGGAGMILNNPVLQLPGVTDVESFIVALNNFVRNGYKIPARAIA